MKHHIDQIIVMRKKEKRYGKAIRRRQKTVGKLNYFSLDVDRADFGRRAEELCKQLGVDYYIKDSLRKEVEK